MTYLKVAICTAALALFAFICVDTIGASSDDGGATSHAVSVDGGGDDTASIPDFDGDGTIGLGDFVIFAGVFGLSQGDEKYNATYDLNEDGEIGFSDFVIFAQNFGKEASSPVVSMPDANLRAAIEMALDKDSGAPITVAEMATMDSLDASDSDISVLTGLQAAVNLTYLSLNDNDIKDISALEKLTNLTELWLGNNQIEDISALSGLTGLTRLSLGRNNITDITALSDLINLSVLVLESNRISDVSPLVTNTGMNIGDTIDLNHNPLDIASVSTEIPALRSKGVNVSFEDNNAVNQPQIYNDNIYVLPVEENLAALWTKSGSGPPLKDYAARFYEYFNDEFDFLIVYPNVDHADLEPEALLGAFYVSVKNDVKGIGLDIYSTNSSWSSEGRLQGLVFHNYDDASIFRGLLLHELMHRWGNFVVSITSFPYGSHWGLSTSGGYLDCYDISNWIARGDGKYSAPDPIYFRTSEQYSPIELYLAGFIPPDEVPDFQVAENGEIVRWIPQENRHNAMEFTASGFKTHTIEGIITEHGPRVPDYLQAQKEFRAAVIFLISEKYPVTRERLERLSSDVTWFSLKGEDESGPPVTNFYEATGGRGTITMDGLSLSKRSPGAKIAVPRSFGTPPPPIVDHWDVGNGPDNAPTRLRHITVEAEQP